MIGFAAFYPIRTPIRTRPQETSDVNPIAPTLSETGRAPVKRTFTRLAAALLAAIGLAGGPAAPAQAQTNDDSADYAVTFQGAWTTTSTPGGVVGGAHFTTLIGAVHNSQVTFWSSGGTATPGIEAVAEAGSTSTFRSEIQAKGSDVATIVRQSVGGGGTGSATFDVSLTRNHPLITLLSMIGPSPDWFVGVSELSLLDGGGQWFSSRSVDLYPYEGVDLKLTVRINNLDETGSAHTTLCDEGATDWSDMPRYGISRPCIHSPGYSRSAQFQTHTPANATGGSSWRPIWTFCRSPSFALGMAS